MLHMSLIHLNEFVETEFSNPFYKIHAREIICQTKFDLYDVIKLVDQNKEGQMSLTSTI